ncbi:MAG TPA: DUF1489 family protein [Sphingomicrobium sp.]|nr:DUF1489 family protein [Sphingomicrobium sp.]
MPKLHLTKVAFGCRDADSLAARIAARSHGGELRVATRMRPRRADELIGGKLYWIVKHRLVAGNEILRIEDRSDGRIDIVCSAELVAVVPTHRRAHQGWRYLAEADAPSQDDDGTGLAELPPRLYGRLAALALV